MSENIESLNLQNLNSLPVAHSNEGEGSQYKICANEDFVLANSFDSSSSYMIGPRFPTNAKVKKILLCAGGIDSDASPAAAVDINVIFSDAPLGGINNSSPVSNDGTYPAFAGMMVGSGLDGSGSLTNIIDYNSPNKLFGSGIVLVNAGGAYKEQDITYAGPQGSSGVPLYFCNTTTPEPLLNSMVPLWEVLGFDRDPNGYFNFYLKATANATTPVTGLDLNGVIAIKIEYTL